MRYSQSGNTRPEDDGRPEDISSGRPPVSSGRPPQRPVRSLITLPASSRESIDRLGELTYLPDNRAAPFMWPVRARQAAQSSRSTHSKVRFQKNPPPTPARLDAADVDLVAGTCNLIGACGLGSLSVAIRSALDGPADAAWAAARALNWENKQRARLRGAGPAWSPADICLGVHTGGSVCLGPEPPPATHTF